MQHWHMRCYPREDGRIDALILDGDNNPIASGVFDTGEEAYAAAREYLEQLKEERDGFEVSQQVPETSIPG